MRSDEEIRDISGKERDFLIRLRARPGMYLGDNSFQRLVSFLDGYEEALYEHGLGDDHCILPQIFHDFVQTKYGIHDTRGYFIIPIYEPDDEKALWLFFDLLDEYLTTNGYEPIGETASGLWYRLRTCIDRYDVFEEIDEVVGFEELLKKRKAGRYREEYDKVKREIDGRKTSDNFPDSVRSSLEYDRGLLQKIVFDYCANEELAQSIAEEVNMLCEGCQVDYHDEWYDRVLAVYKRSGIPY